MFYGLINFAEILVMEKKEMKEVSDQEYYIRRDWFRSMVGKVIYRNATSCSCEICKDVVENGLVVADISHADYLNDWEDMSKMEGHDLSYSETNPNHITQ